MTIPNYDGGTLRAVAAVSTVDFGRRGERMAWQDLAVAEAVLRADEGADPLGAE